MSEIVLENVGYEIEGRWLVRNVNVSLKAGNFISLIGPNGSGKTTLLRLMTGLLTPGEGEVKLNNKQLNEYTRREIAQNITFVPQDTHIDFAFTVKEVVTMGRHPHLGKFGRETAKDREAVNEALERADVADLSNRYATELSGGERQRVIIARSLATEADVLLLDEPTANLDIAHAIDVLELCRKLANEGKTVCIALHDINASARYSNEVILMNKGEIISQGLTENVLKEDTLNEVFQVCSDRTQSADGKPIFTFYRASKM